MSFEATRLAWKIQVKSSSEKLVLLCLADKASDKGECYPSIARISEDTSLSVKTIQKAINSLESLGLVTRERRREGSTNTYKLNIFSGSNRGEKSTINSENKEKGWVNITPPPKVDLTYPLGENYARGRSNLHYKPTNTLSLNLSTNLSNKDGSCEAKKPKQKKPNTNYTHEFILFWESYPNEFKYSCSKQKAFTAFRRLTKEEKSKIVPAVQQYYEYYKQALKQGAFYACLPNPRKYLCEKRFLRVIIKPEGSKSGNTTKKYETELQRTQRLTREAIKRHGL